MPLMALMVGREALYTTKDEVHINLKFKATTADGDLWHIRKVLAALMLCVKINRVEMNNVETMASKWTRNLQTQQLLNVNTPKQWENIFNFDGNSQWTPSNWSNRNSLSPLQSSFYKIKQITAVYVTYTIDLRTKQNN